jgi:exopolyphosphatase/guanosine-5'-triphosphate,3'-diphosphate pyrophosphatase
MAAPRLPEPVTHAPLHAVSSGGHGTVGASVDLGSNSVHLLVAAVDRGRLAPLLDASVFLGLGSAMTERGYLGRAARTELAGSLTRYAEDARGLGSAAITLLGTEPIRRAADAATIVHEVGAATGLPLYVLSHEQEAYLTMIGVTDGSPVRHETLVVDIGGGSSEFCVVDASTPPRAAGLRVGSNGLTDRFVAHDPPDHDDIEALRRAATEAVRDAPDADPVEIVAVGGTASNLLKVLPDAMLDRTLTRERIRDAIAALMTEPAAAASTRHAINLIRARILPAGAAIVEAIMERYDVASVRVSDAGIREGAILAVAHAGPAWRDRLPSLAHGWRS